MITITSIMFIHVVRILIIIDHLRLPPFITFHIRINALQKSHSYIFIITMNNCIHPVMSLLLIFTLFVILLLVGVWGRVWVVTADLNLVGFVWFLCMSVLPHTNVRVYVSYGGP